MKKLMSFYSNRQNLENMLNIINGESRISLRIVDWFATNYAKKYYTLYTLSIPSEKEGEPAVSKRFKVYMDYKLKLRAYSKRRFDPFCRWERINIPYKDGNYIQTTIGQLNFFKWALENGVIQYIEDNYTDIERDMNSRNSTSRKKDMKDDDESSEPLHSVNKTRKRREELSVSATKSIKKEEVEIVLSFN